MEKINVAELLKDCPKGMELDCVMFENVTFVRVDMGKKQFPIEIAVSGIRSKYLTKEGCFHDTTLSPESKCVIFPKGKTTWKGFHRPFKDGDVIYTNTAKLTIISIFKKIDNDVCNTYIDYNNDLNKLYTNTGALCNKNNIDEQRLATEEEKAKLFQAIKEHGYKWNAETKTLEKLPKFKVGDKITCEKTTLTIVALSSDKYIVEDTFKRSCMLHFNNQDKWELVSNINPKFKVGDRIQWHDTHVNPQIIVVKSLELDRYLLDNGNYINFGDERFYNLLKFDINSLVPFESRVLVRNDESQYWLPAFWGCKRSDGYITTFGYGTTSSWCKYCIPYEGNEHLLGTNDDCDEYFKTWV